MSKDQMIFYNKVLQQRNQMGMICKLIMIEYFKCCDVCILKKDDSNVHGHRRSVFDPISFCLETVCSFWMRNLSTECAH